MAWLHRHGWVAAAAAVIELRWTDGGYAGVTATWPYSVATTLPANVATGGPFGVFWSDVLQVLELRWSSGGWVVVRAKVRRSVITTTVREESQVTQQGRQR